MINTIELILLFFATGCNDYQIYSVHEQVSGISQIPRVLEAMDKAGVSTMVILGSPEATFKYTEGFEKHHKNNRQIMMMMQKHPGRFIAYPTIDPRNESDLKKFQNYAENGAMGMRIFSGQWAWFYRHIGPVNRTELYPFLDYANQNNLPVMYNMNPGKENLQAEFEDILKKYPTVKFVCPHFCLSSIKTERFEYLMDTYPNLYTDISFGHYFEDGLNRISNNPEKFGHLFVKYQDRILFGADTVITPNTGNSSEWIANLTLCYRDMLEKESYNCSVRIKKVFNTSITLNGLALNKTVLRKIYHDNPESLMGINHSIHACKSKSINTLKRKN